jgi:hypothetical protein
LDTFYARGLDIREYHDAWFLKGIRIPGLEPYRVFGQPFLRILSRPNWQNVRPSGRIGTYFEGHIAKLCAPRTQLEPETSDFVQSRLGVYRQTFAQAVDLDAMVNVDFAAGASRAVDFRAKNIPGNIILLVGMMAIGKSIVSKQLAALGIDVYDIDDDPEVKTTRQRLLAKLETVSVKDKFHQIYAEVEPELHQWRTASWDYYKELSMLPSVAAAPVTILMVNSMDQRHPTATTANPAGVLAIGVTRPLFDDISPKDATTMTLRVANMVRQTLAPDHARQAAHLLAVQQRQPTWEIFSPLKSDRDQQWGCIVFNWLLANHACYGLAMPGYRVLLSQIVIDLADAFKADPDVPSPSPLIREG